MSMLHIINKSPFERNSLETCLRLAMDQSSILLIEDGAIAADSRTRYKEMICEAQKRFQFYVLEGDLKARGIANDVIINNVKPVGYNQFVDLVTSHDNVQSWM